MEAARQETPVRAQFHIGRETEEDLIFIFGRLGGNDRATISKSQGTPCSDQKSSRFDQGEEKEAPQCPWPFHIQVCLWNCTRTCEEDSRRLQFSSACKEWHPLAFLFLHKNTSFCLKVFVSSLCFENSIPEPHDAVYPSHPVRYYHITSLYFLQNMASLKLSSVFTCLLPVLPVECKLQVEPVHQISPVPRTVSAQ